MIADKIEALLADKGYDADAIREELTKADVEAVIPPRATGASHRARPRKISLAQPRRAPVQQAQELAAHRNTIRQNQGILPRLCQSRVSPAWIPFVHET
jgi:IS5 family transposase